MVNGVLLQILKKSWKMNKLEKIKDFIDIHIKDAQLAQKREIKDKTLFFAHRSKEMSLGTIRNFIEKLEKENA